MLTTAGLTRVTGGTLGFAGLDIGRWAPHRRAAAGIGYVPEERTIFPALTVEQNLLLGLKPGQKTGRWSIEETWRLFPQLRERADAPGGALSGGEQQMLTICRTLLGNPSLIMIDEPTEGLAPKIVDHLLSVIKDINDRGVTVLLVEQKMMMAMKIVSKCIVVGHGQVVFEGEFSEIRNSDEIRKKWLEVS